MHSISTVLQKRPYFQTTTVWTYGLFCCKLISSINSSIHISLLSQKSQTIEGIDPQTILQAAWPSYPTAKKDKLNPDTIQMIEKTLQCRKADGLGYHKFQCQKHSKQVRVVPHTCKTKICSCCAKIQNDIWGEQIKERLPKEKYFHITFTMPQEFRDFFSEEDTKWKRKSDLYDLAWRVIKGYFSGQQKLLTGCIIVLHTFGRALNMNPHLHIILPAGGLRSRKEWRRLESIPRDYLAAAWKNNLLEYVLTNTSYLQPITDEILQLLQSQKLDDYVQLQKLLKQAVPTEELEKWQKVLSVNYYVNIGKRKAYGAAVSYVARYTRRLPVAKSKIIQWDERKQLVTWRYWPHNQNSPVDVTLHAHDFIDKLIRHMAPKNFRLVRYYGVFATKNVPYFRPILQKLCQFDTPGSVPTWRERQLIYTGIDPLICPCCKSGLQLVEKAFRDTTGILKIKPVTND
jgi:hypothetical protein